MPRKSAPGRRKGAAAVRRAAGQPEARAQRVALAASRYAELSKKHQALVRQSSISAAERAGVLALALFALRATDQAVALADREHVRFRNRRWHLLERERLGWRAVARDAAAPAGAPTLMHLAVAAAAALLQPSAPSVAGGRYERPADGALFDVRFERTSERGVVGVLVRDVTRLVRAERELALGARPPAEASAAPSTGTRGRGGGVAGR